MSSSARSPRVSVVMASYNHASYVGRAVGSVLAQTLGDLELVVRDDASTDSTYATLRAFSDPRIRASAAPLNQGVSATYNACIAEARGEFIAVLNSDDYFEPGKLAAQAAILDARPDVGAVFTQARLVDEHGTPIDGGDNLFRQGNRDRHAWLRRFFLEGNCLCHPSVMIRRALHERIGNYDPRFAQIHDFDLWIRVCLVREIHVIEEPLTCFRMRAGGANANNARPETLNRIMWEYTHVLRRFAAIDSNREFAAIFPEADFDIGNGDAHSRMNALAKLAINVPNLAHVGLALDLLHRLFGELGADEVLRRFGLPLSRYLALTGETDLFRAREVAQLRGN